MNVRGLVAVLSLLCLAGCGGFSKLDWPPFGRASWQHPEKVVASLGLKPGDHVADLGAGEGYFLPYLEAAVGPEGRVYAVDVEQEVVDDLDERFEPPVEPILGAFDDPGLPDGSVDVVLVVNTYHHIEERPSYFRRLQTDLRPGARVAILEPNAELGGLLGLTLDEGHKSAASDVRREMGEAGYRLLASHDFLPVQIFEVFEVPETEGR